MSGVDKNLHNQIQEDDSGIIRTRVAIVGAGASGLQCCSLLIREHGFSPDDIILLEARNRIGGRIYTTDETRTDIHGKEVHFAMDHGAAWIHGTGMDWGIPMERSQTEAKPIPNPVMELLHQNTPAGESVYTRHLKRVCSGNPWMRPQSILHNTNEIALFVGGKRVDNHSSLVKAALKRHYAILKAVSDLGDDMFGKGLGMDTVGISLQEAISRVVAENDFLENAEGTSTEERDLIVALTPFYQHLLECWYGASASDLTLCEFTEDEPKTILDDERYTEEGDFYGPHCTVRNGMREVLNAILRDGVEERVKLEQEVTRIEKDKSGIIITTTKGLSVRADCCVVTIPAGCLKEAALKATFFEPNLSKEKIEAICYSKMGSYKKVFLTFDRIFWPEKESFIGLVRKTSNKTGERRSIGNYLLIDNLWARDGIPCLEAILFGKDGEWSAHKSTEEIKDAVLNFLEDSMDISHEPIQNFLVNCHVTRWEEDPYSRGAYSAMTLGALGRHVDELKRSEWDGSLIFSGEATISEFEGSVYAALFSGTNAATAVAKHVS